ncbi:hypothetical protein [Corynebacterium aurimucosum]
MSNIDKAAQVLMRHWGVAQLDGIPDDETKCCAQALADAGLLAPDVDDITRLTIVNDEGRALEEWGINNLSLETQDDGRTLKIFYTKKQA